MAPGITTGPSIAGGQSLRIPLGPCHFLRPLEWNTPMSRVLTPVIFYLVSSIAIMSDTNGSYLGLQLFVGSTFVVGTVFAIAARVAGSPHWRSKF